MTNRLHPFREARELVDWAGNRDAQTSACRIARPESVALHSVHPTADGHHMLMKLDRVHAVFLASTLDLVVLRCRRHPGVTTDIFHLPAYLSLSAFCDKLRTFWLEQTRSRRHKYRRGEPAARAGRGRERSFTKASPREVKDPAQHLLCAGVWTLEVCSCCCPRS